MNERQKFRFKFFSLIVIVLIAVFFIVNTTRLLKKPTNTFVVEKGSISYEESCLGYIIRDEELLQGENENNEMVQIKYENEKVAKGEPVFRYYSKNEENLIKKITDLDEKINKALEENESIIISSDMVSIESQIESTLKTMYNTNELRKLNEYIKKVDGYITKKAQIAGEHSPTGSLIKNLINERATLEAELNSSAEIITSNKSGIASYRVDGLEEYLKCDDFSYLSKSTLDQYNLKTGATVPQSTQKGKVVNNFLCYIATCIDTEKADGAKVDDEVILRLANSKEIPAKIVHIVEEQDGSRILVFEIKDQIEELIEYRKISLEIVWWQFSGFKISNSAISVDENDIAYIQKKRAGYAESVPVKILRQNDTYSIVKNYTDEELAELGFSEEEIKEIISIKLHDEIMLH